MKKLFYILTLAFVASLAVLSCQKEKAQHEPGPADLADCYGVYFPTQDAAGDHVFNPTQDPVLEITVARTNSKGAITVPIVTTFSEDGIFEVEPVQFADGQEETTFKVKFPNAVEGTTYKGSLLIEDPQYARNYGNNPIAMDFSLMRVEMVYLLNPLTQEKAKVHWVQGWWGEEVDTYVKYYELDGIRYCFTETITNTHYDKASGEYYTADGFWGKGEEWTFVWFTKNNNADGRNLIRIPRIKTGYYRTDYGADVYAMDYFFYNKDSEDNAEFLKYAADNSDVVSYYDGMGGFYLSIRSYYMYGVGGWNPGAYDTYGIAEGYSRVDYTIEVEQAGVSVEGEVPVTFTLGPDVNKAVYTFAEGQLTPTQIANTVASLSFSSKDAITDGTGTYNFNLGKTGVYTLVAASFDEKGTMQKSADCKVIYLTKEDAEAYAVVINGGVGSAAKYTPKGVNTDTAVEIYAYGKDIVEAKLAVFSYVDLAGNYDACKTALMKTKSLPDSTLAAINGDGYVDVAAGLLPGTEYSLMVYASNGYSETVEVFGSEYTTGDPLMIYRKFTAADFDPDFAAASKADMIGSWNYYGVDVYGSLGLREYLGKVEISNSERADEHKEPEEGDPYDNQYVYVKGLSAGGIAAAKEKGYCDTDDDTVEFTFVPQDECLWVSTYWGIGYDTYEAAPFYFQQYASASDKWYRATYYMAAIPVADGYFAFVDVNGGGYEFNGWRFIAGNYVWTAFTEPLLVDPDKDDSGKANSPALNAAVASAKKLMRESVKETDNLVMTQEGRMRAAMQKYYQKQAAVQAFGTFAGVEGGELPLRTVQPVSVKPAGYMAPKSHRNDALDTIR